MGKLLSLLARDDSNCCSSPRYDIFLDFENAAPTETEREVYEEVQRVLLESDEILREIQCYKDAGKEIKEAIADPSDITQERAWRAVRPLVDKLQRSYNHSLELQRMILKELIREAVSIIENKNTDANTNAKKVAAWSNLRISFNNMAHTPRTLQQIKAQWGIIKMTEKKKKCLERKRILQTGGGPPPVTDTPTGDDISVWLPHEFTVDSNEFDSDTLTLTDNKLDKKETPIFISLCENATQPTQPTQQEIQMVVPRLLGSLVGGGMSPTQHLEQQQALVKQFAEILEFVLKFDEHKMKTPAIQNDFSYYRRLVNRSGVINTNLPNGEEPHIGPEVANRMSLFYAQATPMLKVLSEATSQFVNDNQQDLENTTETLSTMAKVCLRMLENPKLVAQFSREETSLLVLRVMVGLIILYDWVHPSGAFCRSSSVDVKGCVKFLQQQPPPQAESLLNALRYTTKHLNSQSTPKNIRTLLAA